MIDRNTAAVSVFQAGFELERDRRDVRRAAAGPGGAAPVPLRRHGLVRVLL